MNNSPFLFDDREYFLYGDTSVYSAEYVELVTKLKQIRDAGVSFIKNTFMATTLVGILQFSGQANIPMSVKPAKTYGSSMRTYSLKELSKSLRQSRDFLGLTQKEAAEVLGLGTSTVEKIEQQVSELHKDSTLEKVESLDAWVNVLKANHGARKFVLRPLVRAKLSFLGGKTPLEYAKENPETGIYELTSLERKING